ncbi:MAG: GNAT family N-acetyltransferase [Bacillota bacterium]
MEIKYLADSKENIEEVIDWLYKQWGDNYEYGKEVWEKRIYNRLVKKTIPTTFIALENDEAIGTASIIEHDMDIKKELTPWLADVYVKEENRGKKVATKLIKRVIKEARDINVKKLYLYTREAEGLYKKLGWEVIEKVNYYGDHVPIMVLDLN